MHEPEQGPGEEWTEGWGGDWEWGDEPRRNHRRTAMGALTVIVVAALFGGLIMAIAGGSGARALAAAGHREHAAQRHVRALSKVQELRVRETGAAERALLALTDLPAGWAKASGAPKSSTAPVWSKQLAACVGVPEKVAKAEPTKVTGPNFTSADKTLAVEDSVALYPSVRLAREQFAALDKRTLPACMEAIGSKALKSSIQSEVGSGASVGTVAIAPLTPGQYGPKATGFTVTIPLSASGGRTLTITSTEVEFTVGALTQELTFNGNGTTFPAPLQQHLIITALGKP
jgi:hypothetical protein